MAYNGAGVFDIDTAGQPVVAGTTIDATVFNALTADLATGLSTAITKDGQTTVSANIPMAGYKITGVGLGTSATDAAIVANANALNMCEGRLTLATGVPVTVTDYPSSETLYYTPYKGNHIALYNGSSWLMRTFTETSIDVPDVTGVHDVFCYDNNGTPTLEVLVWSTDTARATALTLQDGVLVKTGATTRRYLGTFYSTTAGNGQISDAAAGRYLWNYYNRAPRPMYALEATNSWNYTTATIRQANGATANQLNFVVGVDEEAVHSTIMSHFSNNNATTVAASVGFGLDATNSFNLSCVVAAGSLPGSSGFVSLTPTVSTYPGIGKHYLAWLEYSEATGTTTWYGDNNSGAGVIQSAIRGYIMG